MDQRSDLVNPARDSSPRFTYFALLWAVAAYFHQLTWVDWFPYRLTHVYIFCTILVLLKPQSLLRFAIFVGVSIIHVFKHSPYIANHLTFELLVNCSIFAVLVLSFLFNRYLSTDRAAIYLRLAPIVRLSAIILYAFAFLAKLNWDFFIPVNSCALSLLSNIVYAYPAIPDEIVENPHVAWWAVWLTVVVEFLVPLFLVLRKTRIFGIIFGIGFHFVMGLLWHKGVYSFSMLFLVIYVLFLPEGAFKNFVGYCEGLLRRFKQIVPNTMLRQLIIITCVYLPQILYKLLDLGFHYGIYIWFFIFPALSTVYIFSLWQVREDSISYRDTFLPQPLILSLLFIPLLLNGIAPYIGLKTQGSMTMFSNLRVLGDQPNHIFMPKSWRIFEQDLIRIVDSNGQMFNWYKNTGNYMTEYELQRNVYNFIGHLYVVYEHNGKRYAFDNQKGGQLYEKYSQPLPLLKRHIIRFKSIDQAEHARCRW